MAWRMNGDGCPIDKLVMTDIFPRTRHFLLVALMAVPFVFAPLSGSSRTGASRVQGMCVGVIDVAGSSTCCLRKEKTPTCCPRESSGRFRPMAPGQSSPSPGPRGLPSDCSCHMMIGGEIVLGVITWSGHLFIENMVTGASVMGGTTDCPGWCDPLLRPPIS